MKKNILVTGGAGFIGTNVASYFIKAGHNVTVMDDLSRPGTSKNLSWLKRSHSSFCFTKTDITNFKRLRSAVERCGSLDAIIHLAGQVAVTTSVENPREDFQINAMGTFNLLEAVREVYGASSSKKVKLPFVIFSSTNKVYGGMEGVRVIEKNGKYGYRDFKRGISESQVLDFHSPYGCSKGAADQYVRDYSRIYGIGSAVFRQSCVYGYRQFGVEDQGWVAWFIIAAILGKKITIYGDGKQVRDVLFIDDLVSAYKLAIDNKGKLSGGIFNIGGGPRNVLSILELINLIEARLGKKIPFTFEKWRPGDQPVFVCDIRKAKKEFGWSPSTKVKNGVSLLFSWVDSNKRLFDNL
jgi:CDP-paratose 2-epimerase